MQWLIINNKIDDEISKQVNLMYDREYVWIFFSIEMAY